MTLVMGLGCGDDAMPMGDAAPDSTTDATLPDSSADSDVPDADTPDGDTPDGAVGDAMLSDAATPDAATIDADLPDATPGGPCTEVGAACEGGFCRETMAGGLECHPWRTDGESCGGFTAPWSIERCDPSLTCIGYRPRLPDATGVCGVVATAGEVIRSPSTYSSGTVGILSAYLGGGTPGCTRRGCTRDMPCCNRCNSTMVISTGASMVGPGSALPARKMGAELTCMGTAGSAVGAMCDPYSRCTDGLEAERTYVVVGRAVDGGREGWYFDIQYGPNPTFP